MEPWKSCQSCGAQIPADALFCTKCGRRVASAPSVPLPKKRGRLVYILGGIIVLLVLWGIAGTLSNGGGKPTGDMQARAQLPAAPGSGSSQASNTTVNPDAVEAVPSPIASPVRVGAALTPTAFPSFPVVVAGTGGEGIYIRRAPAGTDKIKAWPDGTTMLVIGPDQMVGDKNWRNVKDPEGTVGWVPVEYVGIPTATPAPTDTPRPTPTIDLSRYKLELIAANGVLEYGFAKVEGQVKNISGTSLDNVEVVIEYYTADNQFVKKAEALIDYDPILPGQTSPFATITTHNPAMTKYSITFKELLGGTIPTLDSRKR